MTNQHPLRLAVGSHERGSGRGCAMNVISWENGDTTITDLPACADPMLARIVQNVNDAICTHRDGDLLCPACSIKVLELAHRTVGTGGLLTGVELCRVWVRVACRLAREVAHLNPDPRVMVAIEAAEVWADNPTRENAAAAGDAAAAYDAAAYDAAAYAADADAAYDAAFAAAYGAAAFAAFADAAYDDAATARLRFAHMAIDVFNELTGHTDHTPDPTVTHTAIAAMTEVAR